MAANDMTWSFQVRTQMAASSPSSTPPATERISVVPISSSVGHSRARISGSTGLWLRNE